MFVAFGEYTWITIGSLVIKVMFSTLRNIISVPKCCNKSDFDCRVAVGIVKWQHKHIICNMCTNIICTCILL